jgi:hypothetical protein
MAIRQQTFESQQPTSTSEGEVTAIRVECWLHACVHGMEIVQGHKQTDEISGSGEQGRHVPRN